MSRNPGAGWEGDNEGPEGHRASQANNVAEGKTTGRQREGRGSTGRKEKDFWHSQAPNFPRGEQEGSWDTQFPLPECKAALHHSTPTASPHPFPLFLPSGSGKSPWHLLSSQAGSPTAAPSRARLIAGPACSFPQLCHSLPSSLRAGPRKCY